MRFKHSSTPENAHVQRQPAIVPPALRSRGAELSMLFGVLYFIQGVTEPTEGLLTQPVNSLLKDWGHNTAQIAYFSALLSLPWAIKPLYGLISDCIPLAGFHRKSYLLASSAIACVTAGWLFALEPRDGAVAVLFAWMLPMTAAVAFSDVVIDALMVAKGQPLGLTGRLQAAQWTAIYAATIGNGMLGGYMAEHSQQRWAFLICAALALAAIVLTARRIDEPPATLSAETLTDTWRLLTRTSASRTMLVCGAFMFCWNFNPFSSTVLYMYLTTELGLSEQFYGNMQSIEAVAATTGCLLYGFYCRRISTRRLVDVSIVMGIVSTAGYVALEGPASARIIAVVVGFATATATLIQLDIAAQVCPPRIAGSLFAIMMALANLGISLGRGFGGWCYEQWHATWGAPRAFQMLVAVGALFMAACWLLAPLVKRDLRGAAWTDATTESV